MTLVGHAGSVLAGGKGVYVDRWVWEWRGRTGLLGESVLSQLPLREEPGEAGSFRLWNANSRPFDTSPGFRCSENLLCPPLEDEEGGEGGDEGGGEGARGEEEPQARLVQADAAPRPRRLREREVGIAQGSR